MAMVEMVEMVEEEEKEEEEQGSHQTGRKCSNGRWCLVGTLEDQLHHHTRNRKHVDTVHA